MFIEPIGSNIIFTRETNHLSKMFSVKKNYLRKRNTYFHNVTAGSPENDEEVEDLLCLDLTHEEIKAAFRHVTFEIATNHFCGKRNF